MDVLKVRPVLEDGLNFSERDEKTPSDEEKRLRY